MVEIEDIGYLTVRVKYEEDGREVTRDIVLDIWLVQNEIRLSTPFLDREEQDINGYHDALRKYFIQQHQFPDGSDYYFAHLARVTNFTLDLKKKIPDSERQESPSSTESTHSA